MQSLDRATLNALKTQLQTLVDIMTPRQDDPEYAQIRDYTDGYIDGLKQAIRAIDLNLRFNSLFNSITEGQG